MVLGREFDRSAASRTVRPATAGTADRGTFWGRGSRRWLSRRSRSHRADKQDLGRRRRLFERAWRRD